MERALEGALEVVRSTPRDSITATEWLETTARISELTAASRDASSGVRQALVGGARGALLLYLRTHAGQTVPTSALEGVSAIRAWERRIRELREIGWDIVSTGSGYRLNTDQLDEDTAQGDQIIDSIKGATAKERIIEYLVHLSPWAASPRQLERVAGTHAWRQAIGELVEDGWLIRTHDDDPELAPGFYRLAKLED
ncbi:hypothetical protein Pth03_11790 [Planotetraspora thailandica]|uniref:Uncharacterized protein n=1 Tax=Planotetraspora thailandica TaxID=487172 RepID=A0A8J3XU60_9ACTN|nr:hypothetical protein [Planotetraspora thailandica]GII52790.1 hypothetical protein Pth03_11790 [Planotetraspora thailandica]